MKVCLNFNFLAFYVCWLQISDDCFDVFTSLPQLLQDHLYTPPTPFCDFYTFLHWGQFVVPLYFRIWGHPMEHSWQLSGTLPPRGLFGLRLCRSYACCHNWCDLIFSFGYWVRCYIKISSGTLATRCGRMFSCTPFLGSWMPIFLLIGIDNLGHWNKQVEL